MYAYIYEPDQRWDRIEIGTVVFPYMSNCANAEEVQEALICWN